MIDLPTSNVYLDGERNYPYQDYRYLHVGNV